MFPAAAALQAHLELGQPLLLEVARYLTGPAADSAIDPAFGAHHALLQFGAAAEQLQELGAMSASGAATPLGAVSWALQQGKLAAAALPTPAAPARYVRGVEHVTPHAKQEKGARCKLSG